MVAQHAHTRTLSASALFYLYADRVIAPGNWRNGITLPGKEMSVNLGELAATLFAVAFWNLRENGLLQLNVAKGKVLFIFSVTRVDITAPQRVARPGLEGELLAQIGDAGDDVAAVIKRWYGRDLPNPYATIVEHVAAEAAGYLDTVDVCPRAVSNAEGEATPEPNAAALAAIAGPFAECEARWQGFKAAEATLYTALINACKRAIFARRESDRDDDNDNGLIF